MTDPTGAAITLDATVERDRAIDLVRIASLLVVVFGHCALLLATIDGTGLRVGNLLGALPDLAPITWLVQVMPLFFVAGGAAGALGYRAGTPWGAWLFRRAQRLCRPVLWYLAAWTVGLLAVRAVLGEASAARLGQEVVALLWFLGVYLVVLGIVPACTRLRSGRAVACVVAAVLGATAALDAARFGLGSFAPAPATFVLVWSVPAIIGVAYARGFLRPRTASVGAVAALAAQTALAAVGPYQVSLITTGTALPSNVGPPTLLLGLQCVWMSLAFAAVSGPLRRVAARPLVWRAVVVGNGGAMTLYLWHIPAIAVCALALHAAGLDAYDVRTPGFWWLLALRAVAVAVAMAALFMALSPLEHRPLPWWDAPCSPVGVRASAAGAGVCLAGVALVALAARGLGDAAGNVALAVFVGAAIAARTCAGRSRPEA